MDSGAISVGVESSVSTSDGVGIPVAAEKATISATLEKGAGMSPPSERPIEEEPVSLRSEVCERFIDEDRFMIGVLPHSLPEDFGCELTELVGSPVHDCVECLGIPQLDSVDVADHANRPIERGRFL